MKKIGLLLFCLGLFQIAIADNRYTVIDYDYHSITARSENDISILLKQIRHLTLTQKINYLANSSLINNHPYISVGAEGEGNLCGINDKKTCVHIQQDPIYRTDLYDCTTLVSTILALIHSENSYDFNNTIIKVEYGAAGNLKDPIHYYNRNNFISSAFNPVNEANHYLENATFKTPLYSIKTISSIIDVPRWFSFQQRNSEIKNNVRVLDENNGLAMVSRFLNHYPPYFSALKPHSVALSYIPKQNLVSCTDAGNLMTCIPNEAAINALPTPAVAEVVRDDTKWLIDGKSINDLIGSGINVSHLGIIFRKTFKKGKIIYQRIICSMQNKQKACQVTPIKCARDHCTEIMFLQATDAYPNNYYWYQTHNGYQCTAQKPGPHTPYTYCNRVMAMPLGDYLMQYEYGSFSYMESPSIVGLHLERIVQ